MVFIFQTWSDGTWFVLMQSFRYVIIPLHRFELSYVCVYPVSIYISHKYWSTEVSYKPTKDKIKHYV